MATRVRQVWKLGDFDAHRMQGKAVGPYTAPYASPEVAKAMDKGENVPAQPTMDIFSLGLVALEMLRRTPLISASSSKEEALRTLGGNGLEAMLREAMEPLPRLQKALLNKMLQISPAERTSAVNLKSSSLLTGNVRGPPHSNAAQCPLLSQPCIAHFVEFLRSSLRS